MRKATLSEAKELFKAAGLTLLATKYLNNKTPMSYICEKGHRGSMKLANVKEGHGCFDCGNQSRSGDGHWSRRLGSKNQGEKHWNWQGGKIPKDRQDDPHLREWRATVYIRDVHACKKCDNKSPLQAHHIKNYSSCIEGRYEVENGITLCEYCHERFHKLFGKENNNQAQVDEFLSNFLM